MNNYDQESGANYLNDNSDDKNANYSNNNRQKFVRNSPRRQDNKLMIVVIIIAIIAIIMSIVAIYLIVEKNSPDEDLKSNQVEKLELDKNELVEIVREGLHVPEDVDVRYEIGEEYYWESGQTNCVSVSFYENDELIACANVNPENGELLTNILMYSPPKKVYSADETLKILLQNKKLISKRNDKRRIIADTYSESYGSGLTLENYDMQEGVLSYYINDFDRDKNYDIFTAEVVNNTLIFKMYKIENDTIVLMDSRNIVGLLDTFVGNVEWTRVFIREHNGEIYAFSEQYISGGLVSDGFSFNIKGYRLSDGLMIEVMNEGEAGSSIEMDYFDRINNVLRSFGLAAVLENYYGEDASVATSSNVKVLATVTQEFNGTYDEIYNNTSTPEYIRPMDIKIDVNR